MHQLVILLHHTFSLDISNKEIPSANFNIHEVHCKRNFFKCDKCDEMVSIATKDAHAESHAMVSNANPFLLTLNKESCKLCSKQVEKRQIESHQETECTERPEVCTYCQITVPFSQLYVLNTFSTQLNTRLGQNIKFIAATELNFVKSVKIM